MPQITKLSEIASEIDRLIHDGFSGKTFLITTEISSVKKIASKRWCFLDFTQTDENGETRINGVCWARHYDSIELFESATGKEFKSDNPAIKKVSVGESGIRPQSQGRLFLLTNKNDNVFDGKLIKG